MKHVMACNGLHCMHCRSDYLQFCITSEQYMSLQCMQHAAVSLACNRCL